MARHESRLWEVIAVLLAVYCGVLLSACGSSSTSSSDSSDGTETGSTGSNDGSGGGSDTGTGFRITGTVSTLDVTGSLSKALSSGTVTDVVAVSPGAGDAGCKTAEVAASGGTFSLRLPSSRPWFIYFIDRIKRGTDMYKGRVKSGALDTLAPANTTGSLDLGSITIDGAAETATSEKTNADIVSGLGLETDAADAIGGVDDMAQRYANPDVDNNGSLDCNTTSASQPYMLDFHVRFNVLLSGVRATVASMINTYWGTDVTTTQYANTGIYVVYPTTFSSVSSGSVVFSDSAVTTDEGGAIAAGTSTTAVTNNDFGSNHSFGPNISTTSELPSGTIVFTVGGSTLTFTDVVTPSLATLNAPTGRIFPFLKFNTTDTSCTSNCTIDSVEYKWMKKSSAGWTAATTTELGLLVDGDGGFLSIRVDNNANKTIGITLPKTSASGTIDWAAASASLSGVTSAEMTNMVTTQLCHLGISYDDTIGMRYFESADDAAGTCQ